MLSRRIQDAVVDLRKDSPTFAQQFSIELDTASNKQLFVLRGFAYGFLTLSESIEEFYKYDNYYNKVA